MICWMFPGQPVAFSAIPVHDPEFREISGHCRRITGYDPSAPTAPDSSLAESVKLQLFGTTMSLYHAAVLGNTGEKPDIVAEHSMGIYPALAAAGSIEPETALELTWRIGTCMAKMGRRKEYALGCVIGMDVTTLQPIADKSGVYIANHNTSRHFLLAGERNRIETAMKEAVAARAFSVSIFPCDAPLHTPLIEEIARDLQRIIDAYDFQEPAVPLLEHITQTAMTAGKIPAFLVDELCKPVYWDKTYRALCAGGTTKFQELTATPVLAKFNRWIDSEK